MEYKLVIDNNRFIGIVVAFALSVLGYTLAGVGVGFVTYLILLLLYIGYLLRKRMNFSIKKSSLLLIFGGIFAIVLQIINYFRVYKNEELLTTACVIAIMLFLLVTIPKIIDARSLYYGIKCISFVASVIMIFQFIEIYIFNVPVSQIYILPRNWAFIDAGDFLYRPVSIFTEPSAYGNYVAMCVILALMHNERTWAAYFSITIFLSTSLTGICIVLVVYGLDGWWNKRKIRPCYYFVIFLVIPVVIFAFRRMILGGLDLPRYIRSFEIRFLNGFNIIRNMTFNDLLWGIGSGNIYQIYGRTSESFMSGIPSVYVNYGIVMLVIYSAYLIKMITGSKAKSYVKIIAIVLFVLSWVQSMFFNGHFLMWILLYYVVQNDEKISSSFNSYMKKEII